MNTVSIIVGAILGLIIFFVFASLVLGCYLVMLSEAVRFIAGKFVHRWVTLGLLLVVLSVVAGVVWNSLEVRIVVVLTLILLPSIRFWWLLWSMRGKEYGRFEKMYAFVLFFVGFSIVAGPLSMVPRAVWQSFGPIFIGR